MPTLALAIPPRPEHVRTARLVAVSASRRAGLADGVVDELRLAVGEACARAVALHLRHAPDVPVEVVIREALGTFVVEVSDVGPAPAPSPGEVGVLLQEAPEDPDVALAFLAGLVEDVAVTHSGRITTVRLRWGM